MNGDYLWDRTGEPDVEVARLERLLAPLRGQPGEPPRRSKPSWHIAAAAAAVVAAALGVSQVGPAKISRATAPEPGWKITAGRVAGAELRRGERLVTASRDRVEIELADVGRVTIAPGSELAVGRNNREQLSLRHGRIEAFIWAPPGRFVVDTPSAVTVDLGCAYTLDVEPDGSELVRVTTGWVAFEGAGRESFIPAGARCRTGKGKGPGTPVYETAAPALIAAVERFDATQEASAIEAALASARTEDAMTLWHLLRRAPEAQRGAVYDRFAALAPIPSGVTRHGVLSGDKAMQDALWDSLDLGNSAFWREWKRTLR